LRRSCCSSIPRKQVTAGAFVDPKTLTGQVAATDIYPGQQLTTADFTVGVVNALTQNLARDQRAVVVPIDAAGTVGGQVAAGDTVDVWILFNSQGANGVSRPVVREVFQKMHVLAISGGNVTFRATPRQAGELIYASANARVWLVLRPTVGSTTSTPPVITGSDLLNGSTQVGG